MRKRDIHIRLEKLKKSILLMLLVALFSGICFPAVVSADPPVKFDLSDIKADSFILAEADRGQKLLSRNPDKKLHISAACKLMTVLIAVENGNLQANITISKDSVEVGGSALNLEAGEKYTLEDLLYGIMLTSANDAAIAVAEHIAGDMDSFVNLMNQTAAKLKMKDTRFTNATGLYDEEQYTTANDICRMISYAIRNPEFKKIFSTNARPWTHNGKNTTILTSPNKLFWSYEGIEGGKTGYNNKELQSLIATATRDNLSLICIVLDSPEKHLFTDATSLFDTGFDEFKKSVLVKAYEKFPVVDANGKEINLVTRENIYYVHPCGESYIEDLKVTADVNNISKSNQIAGTATYLLSDGTAIDVPLYPENEVAPDNLLTSSINLFKENRNILWLLIVLVSIEIILIIIKATNYFIRKKPKNPDL